MKFKFEKLGLFAGGVVFGAVGLKALWSKDAKKVYAHTTAGVLRAREEVLKNITKVREESGDILAEAKEINEKRNAAAEVTATIDDQAKDN